MCFVLVDPMFNAAPGILDFLYIQCVGLQEQCMLSLCDWKGSDTCLLDVQLVLYPILNLKRHECDLHWYLRQLEQVVIRTLWEVSGLSGERFEGLTGVWFKKSKIAAIGVRAKRCVVFWSLNFCNVMFLSSTLSLASRNG